MGSLDKELIRRVIKQHLAQIRYCYEKELVRFGLFGKVARSGPSPPRGTVRDSKNRELEHEQRRGRALHRLEDHHWVFPKPKGGGIVIVRYPFVFKTTG